MHVYERTVRFEEVDAAQIVFFARYLSYAHEAMESLLGELEGGYVRLVSERKVGMPAVHVDIDYKAPARFGDALRIEVDVPHVGRKSCVYRYRVKKVADGTLLAEMTHTCVVSDLVRLKGIEIPDDVRALLELHRV